MKLLRPWTGRGPGQTGQRIPAGSIQNKKTAAPDGVTVFLVEEGGFEPPKQEAADLQSVPFGHSGTPPYTELRKRKLIL